MIATGDERNAGGHLLKGNKSFVIAERPIPRPPQWHQWLQCWHMWVFQALCCMYNSYAPISFAKINSHWWPTCCWLVWWAGPTLSPLLVIPKNLQGVSHRCYSGEPSWAFPLQLPCTTCCSFVPHQATPPLTRATGASTGRLTPSLWPVNEAAAASLAPIMTWWLRMNSVRVKLAPIIWDITFSQKSQETQWISVVMLLHGRHTVFSWKFVWSMLVIAHFCPIW